MFELISSIQTHSDRCMERVTQEENLNVYPLTVIELPSTLAGDPTKSLKHTKSGKETLNPLTIILGMLSFIVETPY